jgi:nucleosome binding factor SPN SPT16 subunit
MSDHDDEEEHPPQLDEMHAAEEDEDLEEEIQPRTRSSRRTASKENQEELQRLAEAQQEIRNRKIEELKARLLGQESGEETSISANRNTAGNKLSSFLAYDSIREAPHELRRHRMYVDQRREVLWIPMSNGTLLPVNVRCIKGITKSDENHRSASLRLIFHTPGAAFSQSDLFPSFKPDELERTVFLKEVSIRAEDSRNMSSVFRTIKELQKRQRVRDQEMEQQRGIKEQPQLKLSREKRISLKDVNIRPQIGATGRSRAVGNLEAHETGFRFNSSKGEHVDVIYTNIKHAIYQPCENDQLVLIHLHLIDPIIVGKKKTQDIQFYTETRSVSDDLNQRRRAGGYDPDEIMEEQREREMIERLNKTFKRFVKECEEEYLEKYNMDFDIPYRELGFQGTPGKSNVDIFPCRDCLISVSEWPPFVLTIEEVDIVYFERVSFGLRNFDMVFVFKDYSKPPARISSIPVDMLVAIKQWLGELSIPWYEGPTNMNWTNVLKEVLKDKVSFVEGGGWEGWFGEAEEESDEDDEDSEYEDEESDYGSEEGGDDEDDEDASEGDGDDSDESSYADEDSDDSEASLESDESEGLDWDELEQRAVKSDKKKAKKHKDSDDDSDDSDRKPKKKKHRR